MQLKLAVAGNWQDADPNEATVERAQAMRLDGVHEVTGQLIETVKRLGEKLCAALPDTQPGAEDTNIKTKLEELRAASTVLSDDKFRLTCTQLIVRASRATRAPPLRH